VTGFFFNDDDSAAHAPHYTKQIPVKDSLEMK